VRRAAEVRGPPLGDGPDCPLAVGAVFYKPGVRTALHALVGAEFTVIVQGAMNVALTPFGIPTLTGPFVLASWLFLLPRPHFGQD